MAESDAPQNETAEEPQTEQSEADESTEGTADSERPEGSYLRPGEQSAWERWELPAMDSEHVVSRGGRTPAIREEEIEVQPLSLEELEKIREEARLEGVAEGREAGYREGREQGLKDGAEEIRMQRESLQAALQELSAPLEGVNDELEEALAVTAAEIARHVIRAELQARPEMIRDIARDAIRSLAEGSGPVRVDLHPDDLALLEGHLDEESKWQAKCELRPDDALERGGVRVERGLSSVDFSLDHRFRAAIEGFVTEIYLRLAHAVTEPSQLSDGTAGEAADAPDESGSDTT